jgi:sulfite exporter TauE/SafE
MILFFTLLPIYLFGNVHCLGMCGPLVMLIGQHRHRFFYFIGRLLSFSLAGLLAGSAGAVLHVILKQYYLSETTSFLFGGIIIFLGLQTLYDWQLPKILWLSRLLSIFHYHLSKLMLQDKKRCTFLFGFLTVVLPCGQTLVVFSACALAGDPFIGLWNGFALALLTTPSLFLAMHTHILFKKWKHHYKTVLGISSLLIGVLAFCRGFAEIGWMPHWILNPNSAAHYHIVIF